MRPTEWPGIVMYRLFLGQFVKDDLHRFKAMVEAR